MITWTELVRQQPDLTLTSDGDAFPKGPTVWRA
jgi:hypothetical protein